MLILVTSDCRSQSSCSFLPACCGHCSFTSCWSVLSRSGRSFPVISSSVFFFSGSSCAVLMGLRGFLVGLHLPSSCAFGPHEGVRVRLDSPRDRVAVATVLPCRSCGVRVVLGTLSALTPRRHVVGAPCGCPVQRSGLIRPLLLRTDQSLSALWRSRNFRASAYFAIRVFGQMSG